MASHDGQAATRMCVQEEAVSRAEPTLYSAALALMSSSMFLMIPNSLSTSSTIMPPLEGPWGTWPARFARWLFHRFFMSLPLLHRTRFLNNSCAHTGEAASSRSLMSMTVSQEHKRPRRMSLSALNPKPQALNPRPKSTGGAEWTRNGAFEHYLPGRQRAITAQSVRMRPTLPGPPRLPHIACACIATEQVSLQPGWSRKQ